MTASTEANIGLSLGWAYGEDGWNTGMDTNLAVLGGLSQLYVKSATTGTKPVSPTNGDRYYVPVGATGDWSSYEKYIAIYSGFHSDWKYVLCKAGMEFRVADDSDASYYFDGTNLVDSISLAGYLTASSAYTASGLVTFSVVPKVSGSHTADTTEVTTVADVDTAIAAIDYSTFVRTTGAQGIAGVKTFSSSPIVPTPTTDMQASTKKYVDDGLSGKEPTLTKGNLTESIAGLQFDNTRQVIGGAADLGLSSGYTIPTTTNISHAEDAYTHISNTYKHSLFYQMLRLF